ncbi:GerW family sporulation protein [Methanobacterium sp. ACI-7]|uniref:GerW family sporulation protein n=1 Tax=unclassified Methanobacterium TaxID=2627676 RepID=UPI0039C2E11B
MDVEPIKTTVEELLKVLTTENVIGETIETEDKILIPITKFGMAFGAGSGEGKVPGNQGAGQGSGAGGSAGIQPIAMIVVFKDVKGPDGVRVMHLTPPNPIGRAVSEVMPAVIDLLKESKETVKEFTSEEKENKEETV